MIEVYGRPGNEPGDQQVYDVLHYLPSGWLAYAQPKIIKGGEDVNPDFVLVHRNHGLLVLEVKDWISVSDPDAKGIFVERRNKTQPEWSESPVEQARKHAQIINNKLAENPTLRNYCGKLDFPYGYAGILPNLPFVTITWLEQAWGIGRVLGRGDLTSERIVAKITSIPTKFRNQMTDNQFDAVRAIIDKGMSAIDIHTHEFKGIYSQRQEELAKAPLSSQDESTTGIEGVQSGIWDDMSPDSVSRLEQLESDAPQEVLDLRRAGNIRLVRGFSGTGKTDVLVMRARYLYDLHPDLDLLVTTFNVPLVEERLVPEFKKCKDRISVQTFDSLCTAIFKKHTGVAYPNIQDVGGLVKSLQNDGTLVSELINKYGSNFIEQEIVWIKEVGLITKEKYLSTFREGRAKISGQVLPRSVKEEIFEIFETYQHKLNDIRAFDWPDFHSKVNEFIEQGEIPEKLYDGIFIDEAQHFAPSWLRIVLCYLKPSGAIFLCDDPSQSVYRFFSWQQKGINVRGRTRWLRIPYRTTREIFEAGYALIQANSLARNLLEESGDNAIPELSENMRIGERPHAYQFSSYAKEKDFVQKEIQNLIKKILPSEIAILHSEKFVIQDYSTLVPDGVKVDDLKRRTGMEYKVVFIPQIHRLFSGSEINFDYEQAKAQYQLAFYMAMTRARDRVFLLYGQKWPKEFEPLRPYVDWVEG